MTRRDVLACGFMLLACPALAVGGGFATDHPALAGATYVGSDTCLDCHDDAGEFFHATPHSVDRSLSVPGTDVTSCEACHGPGSLHVENDGDGGILGPDQIAAMSPAHAVAMCTQCHASQGDVWHMGPHAGSDMGCLECHADVVHVDTDIRPVGSFRLESGFCLQCHEDQTTDFRMPYRHRVLEGEVSCSDCHSPHGEREARWGIEGRDEACLRCHTEMAGPFVFEHEGVAGEDCTACHRPHGGINDKLLVQDANGLCLQCHVEDAYPTFGEVDHGFMLGQEARCYDCHHEIHGSNLDPNFQDR